MIPSPIHCQFGFSLSAVLHQIFSSPTESRSQPRRHARWLSPWTRRSFPQSRAEGGGVRWHGTPLHAILSRTVRKKPGSSDGAHTAAEETLTHGRQQQLGHREGDTVSGRTSDVCQVVVVYHAEDSPFNVTPHLWKKVNRWEVQFAVISANVSDVLFHVQCVN